MPRDIRAICFDILRSINDIKEFTECLDLDQYRNNRVVKLAVERNYEIIGEALRRMATGFNSEFLSVTNGRKIIDFRNLLIHGYDEIADEIVWAITSSDIELLKKEIEIIFDKHNE